MPNTKVCRGCGDKVSTFKPDKLNLTHNTAEKLLLRVVVMLRFKLD